jgi:hypothetical protein
VDDTKPCRLTIAGRVTSKAFAITSHLNLARARLVRGKEKLSAGTWSSYPQYLQPRSSRPVWLRVDRLLGEHGIQKDSPLAGRISSDAWNGADMGSVLSIVLFQP